MKLPRNTKIGRKVVHPRGYYAHNFQRQRSRSPGWLMMRPEVRHIFRTGRPTNFRLGVLTEHEDPHQRKALWPPRSKVKVTRSINAETESGRRSEHALSTAMAGYKGLWSWVIVRGRGIPCRPHSRRPQSTQLVIIILCSVTLHRASDSMFLCTDFVRVTNCFYDYDYDYDYWTTRLYELNETMPMNGRTVKCREGRTCHNRICHHHHHHHQ